MDVPRLDFELYLHVLSMLLDLYFYVHTLLSRCNSRAIAISLASMSTAVTIVTGATTTVSMVAVSMHANEWKE